MANLAYLQITRECNQECLFCSNPPTHKNKPLHFFKKLIDYYITQKYSGVIFTGGEPTLSGYLTDLIAYAASKKFDCRIITNGQRISDSRYLKSLKDAGLKHVALSIYSDDAKIQSFLTKNPKSLYAIEKAFENISKLGLSANVVTVINKYNADHLSRLVKWITSRYPFVHHFVWNNLDPLMNRASKHPDTIPTLNDFELELKLAMDHLCNSQRTFRVERVPLCYMVEYAHCSTETRKIVKKEERMIYFLDNKKLIRQKGWSYGKAKCCSVCSLNEICAGLYQMDKCYSSEELYPLFVDKNNIIKRINEDEE